MRRPLNQSQPNRSLQRAVMNARCSFQGSRTAQVKTTMNMHHSSSMLEKATSTKLPCGHAPDEWSAVGHFPRSMRWWHRAAGMPVLLLLVALGAAVASAQTDLLERNQCGRNPSGQHHEFLHVHGQHGRQHQCAVGHDRFRRRAATVWAGWSVLGTAQTGHRRLRLLGATNSGTFTVLVSSYASGGTGTYVLASGPDSRGFHGACGR